jgi:hypothetical protein
VLEKGTLQSRGNVRVTRPGTKRPHGQTSLCERIATARYRDDVNIAAGETLNELRGLDQS